MKKHLSILLVMVMILTMTACVTQSDALTATSEPISEETSITEEEYILSDLTELLHLSESENLSAKDMNYIDFVLWNIWNFNPSVHEQPDEPEALFIKIFNNIYDQAIDQSIPLDNFYSGLLYVPNADTMCKYFNSTNFCEPHYVTCYGFKELCAEDKVRVAEAFFANPLFAINTFVPRTIIRNSPNDDVTEMTWQHFLALSTSSDSNLSSESSTQRVCADIFINTKDYYNKENLTEIAKNILNNPHYDFITKYLFFFESLDDEYFFNIAFDSLIELSQNADEETAKQIKALAECLEDNHLADRLLSELGNN